MFDRVLNMPWVLKMPEFWIYLHSQYPKVLNIPGFWIYQNSDYARVLNIPLVLNMPDLHSIECSPLGSWGELKLKKWPEGCFRYFEGVWGWGLGGRWGSQVLVGGWQLLVVHKIQLLIIRKIICSNNKVNVYV